MSNGRPQSTPINHFSENGVKDDASQPELTVSLDIPHSPGLLQPKAALTPVVQIRAVLLGLLVGCLIAFTNLYLGLQSGWISVFVFLLHPQI